MWPPRTPLRFLLAGAKGKITVPIPSYLIVHPKGRALFDSGLNVATQTDPESYITSAGMRFNTFFFESGEEISARPRPSTCRPTGST